MAGGSPKLLARLSLAALIAACASCWAAESMYWQSNAPVGKMKEEDFKIANAVIQKALDEGKDGQTFKWENPATGASGSITPRKAFERNGTTCRKAKFFVSAGGLKNDSRWTLCKVPEGWKVADD
jgi:surface antigen